MPIDPATGLYIPSPPAGYGYGGPQYGYSPYGSGQQPREPYPPGGGFGGAPYGTGSYGSRDTTFPWVSSAASVTGMTVEVFFSEEMEIDAALLDATNYVFTETLGAPITASSVATGTTGSLGGASSVIVTHSGTTLGGTYVVAVSNVVDRSGNPINHAQNTASFVALGETVTYTATATAGDTIRLEFNRDMLPESEFTPGIEDSGSYSLTTTYPVPLVIDAVVHDTGDPSLVDLTVSGMTSASYTVDVTPSDTIEYDGTYVPSTATGFTGVEVGTGTSAVGAGGLLLTKAQGVTYGWQLQDTSGNLTAASTFRADVQINAAAASYFPPLYDAALGTISVSDGSVEVALTLTRSSGVDVIDIVSGAYSVQVPAAWSAGAATISVVRNQKGSLFTFLFNGVPLVSAAKASLTGTPALSPGIQWLLGTVYEVTQLPLAAVLVSASQTVFTAAWNFLHGISTTFVGSAALTRGTLLTQRGPLTKGWGDATPAQVADVTLRVNSTEVEVDSINPYTGEVVPAVPIPLTTPGTVSVDIDYTWFPNPLMSMVLNTPGLVLNKWNRATGRNAPHVSPMPSGHIGVMDDARFPMGQVIGPMVRRKPIYIGHRYMGFERAYSALLNSPTSLTLNQNPHKVAISDLDNTPEGASVAFEGTVAPSAADPAWSLLGTDTGSTGSGDDLGLYILKDESAGTYSTGTAAVYYQEEDLSYPSSGVVAGRLQVTSYTADGVFTGVCFGLHNNQRLFMVGALEINGLKHIGLLKDAANPHLEASWEVGPSVTITITGEKTCSVTTANFPTFAAVGSKFQVRSGSQSGTYKIMAIVQQSDETTTVTVDAAFPADYKLWSNDTATADFEVDWSADLTTYRLVTDVEVGSAQVYVGGAVSGIAVNVTSVAAYPTQTSLLLDAEKQGVVFFGSASRVAVNTSKWSFYRYGITPDQTSFHSRGLVVAAEMSDLPEDDPNAEWFKTQDFGTSEIDASGDTMLLKSISASDALDLSYGYARVEPFLRDTTVVDLSSDFRVESGVLGAGDAQIVIRNGKRVALLATVLYVEGGSPYRRLVHLPSVSLPCLETPTEAGWTPSSTNTVAATAHGQKVTITQALGKEGTWYEDLVLNADSTGGRVIEARLAITSHTANSGGDVGPIFGADVGTGAAARLVGLTFLASPARVALTSDGTPLSTFSFDWTDGEQHSYRLIGDPTTATVSLTVDDVVLGTVDLTLFDLSSSDTMAFLGAYGTDVVSTAVWDGFGVSVLPTASVKRTLGIRGNRGMGNADDIDNWELPRTDATTSANSTSDAVIKEMDWTAFQEVRMLLDPNWGVTVFRPDLPPPPYFDGNWATQSSQPSAGWINVEYAHLPRAKTTFGGVEFGALSGRALTQQRWRRVRYRVYTHTTEDYTSPHHMVLNQYNVITSGERGTDKTVETVTVQSLTSTTVSLKPAHIYAARVFTVTDGSTVYSTTTWSFDADTQVITLTTPLSAENTPVTVSFAPGKPVTSTYLKAQPLLDSVTLLNEGTPPFPKSQTATATSSVVSGSALNNPNDTLNDGDLDFILNDPYQTLEFTDVEGSLYDQLSFFELDDKGQRGLISIVCDGPAPGEGFSGLAVEGTMFTEQFKAQDATVTDGPFSQTSVFHASGGNYVGGNLGPGTMVLYPTAPAIKTPGSGAIERRMRLNMRMDSVFTDTTDSASPVTATLTDTATLAATVDNVPPTYGDYQDENPNGTAGTELHGAATALESDGAGLHSRVGPWGGIVALGGESLLGGGAAVDGTTMTLEGGGTLASPVKITHNIEAVN